jgi:hypothetical protein
MWLLVLVVLVVLVVPLEVEWAQGIEVLMAVIQYLEHYKHKVAVVVEQKQ